MSFSQRVLSPIQEASEFEITESHIFLLISSVDLARQVCYAG